MASFNLDMKNNYFFKNWNEHLYSQGGSIYIENIKYVNIIDLTIQSSISNKNGGCMYLNQI